MLLALVPVVFAVVAAGDQSDTGSVFPVDFGEEPMTPVGILTTSAGAPVEYKDAWDTLNTNLLSNEYLIDDISSLVRERIPERVVHGGGVGGFGYFETTHDISHICKAKLFSKVGKKTPLAARFSLSFARIGSPDTIRETRGFAVKMYTEEGNFDLTGLSIPTFPLRDPLLFNPLLHCFNRQPGTNLADLNMLWDYLTLRPEGLFAVMYLLSDYGTPLSYRHMSAFPVHTYQVHNKDGKRSFIRFHMVPCQGARYLNGTESTQIGNGDIHYYARDLYTSIANSENPSWYLKIQIVSEKEWKNSKTDIFDVTRILPLDKYPLHTVGKIVLTKNPKNHFAQVEQLGFSPGNCVPGIDGSPDKIFEFRRLAYREASLYRLGSNFKKIPVNCPMQSKVLNYIRDGVSPVGDNGKDSVNYFPNSYGGPAPYKDNKRPSLVQIEEKITSNFDQARDFYVKELTSDQRTTLVNNILAYLASVEKRYKTRAVKLFTAIHSELGNRIAIGLAAN